MSQARHPVHIVPAAQWMTPTELRLAWLYGAERAARIIEGRDPKTEADLAAWRRLGPR